MIFTTSGLGPYKLHLPLLPHLPARSRASHADADSKPQGTVATTWKEPPSLDNGGRDKSSCTAWAAGGWWWSQPRASPPQLGRWFGFRAGDGMCFEDRSEVSAIWQELRLVTNEGGKS